MELKAKLIQLLPLQSGEGKNGPWKKQDIIVETESQYPKKVCISIWGDKIDANKLQIGNQLNISFDIESREFNGRWYTDVKAWKIDTADNSNAKSEKDPGTPEEDVLLPSSENDDLPF